MVQVNNFKALYMYTGIEQLIKWKVDGMSHISHGWSVS